MSWVTRLMASKWCKAAAAVAAASVGLSQTRFKSAWVAYRWNRDPNALARAIENHDRKQYDKILAGLKFYRQWFWTLPRWCHALIRPIEVMNDQQQFVPLAHHRAMVFNNVYALRDLCSVNTMKQLFPGADIEEKRTEPLWELIDENTVSKALVAAKDPGAVVSLAGTAPENGALDTVRAWIDWSRASCDVGSFPAIKFSGNRKQPFSPQMIKLLTMAFNQLQIDPYSFWSSATSAGLLAFRQSDKTLRVDVYPETGYFHSSFKPLPELDEETLVKMGADWNEYPETARTNLMLAHLNSTPKSERARHALKLAHRVLDDTALDTRNVAAWVQDLHQRSYEEPHLFSSDQALVLNLLTRRELWRTTHSYYPDPVNPYPFPAEPNPIDRLNLLKDLSIDPTLLQQAREQAAAQLLRKLAESSGVVSA